MGYTIKQLTSRKSRMQQDKRRMQPSGKKTLRRRQLGMNRRRNESKLHMKVGIKFLLKSFIKTVLPECLLELSGEKYGDSLNLKLLEIRQLLKNATLGARGFHRHSQEAEFEELESSWISSYTYRSSIASEPRKFVTSKLEDTTMFTSESEEGAGLLPITYHTMDSSAPADLLTPLLQLIVPVSDPGCMVTLNQGRLPQLSVSNVIKTPCMPVRCEGFRVYSVASPTVNSIRCNLTTSLSENSDMRTLSLYRPEVKTNIVDADKLILLQNNHQLFMCAIFYFLYRVVLNRIKQEGVTMSEVSLFLTSDSHTPMTAFSDHRNELLPVLGRECPYRSKAGAGICPQTSFVVTSEDCISTDGQTDEQTDEETDGLDLVTEDVFDSGLDPSLKERPSVLRSTSLGCSESTFSYYDAEPDALKSAGTSWLDMDSYSGCSSFNVAVPETGQGHSDSSAIGCDSYVAGQESNESGFGLMLGDGSSSAISDAGSDERDGSISSDHSSSQEESLEISPHSLHDAISTEPDALKSAGTSWLDKDSYSGCSSSNVAVPETGQGHSESSAIGCDRYMARWESNESGYGSMLRGGSSSGSGGQGKSSSSNHNSSSEEENKVEITKFDVSSHTNLHLADDDSEDSTVNVLQQGNFASQDLFATPEDDQKAIADKMKVISVSGSMFGDDRHQLVHDKLYMYNNEVPIYTYNYDQQTNECQSSQPYEYVDYPVAAVPVNVTAPIQPTPMMALFNIPPNQSLSP